MRLKRKKAEERNKISVQSKSTENGNNSGTSAAQDDEITTKNKNKRQRTNSSDLSIDGRTRQAHNASSEGKKALSDIGDGQVDPLTDPAITPCIDKKKSKNKKNKSVSVQSNNQEISQTTSTVNPDAKPGNRKMKNKTRKKNSDDEAHKMPNPFGKNEQPKEQSATSTTPAKLQVTPPKMMSTLQKSFLERLTSSRFRELNEDLYTHSSQHSFKHFTENPDLFEQYHIGFRKQVKEWPVNPVDVIYKKILNWWRRQQSQDDKGVKKNGKKGMKNKNKLVVADFGCGDAKLAERLLAIKITNDNGKGCIGEPSSKNKKNSGKATFWCPFEVHSFDLVSGGNKLVTPADMCNVPLPNESVDVGIYSLALMGTNVADFVREGWRVLKFGGYLRVAEVRSRFETAANEDKEGREGGGKRGKMNNGMKLKCNAAAQFGIKQYNNGMDSTQPLMLIDEFLSLMERCGFQCTNFDRSNKMFLFMDFIKVDGSKGLSKNEEFSAKPCIYKRR